ncbi:molybdate ABC transporter substrate-binding protein [Rivibacter subsaxonicus]|uniref:Molybdate transport system substrate-binding protein n=1 Tax=Rivibacter subsaxonicus TaxID=457575 RepID=A0A4Q7VVT6_9BURK|nr:molybdate ABC transporter substrate-binding protein [Rivibacter subsaxonicus]RZU00760.1 molybdate transport system substrate-binding protein [Rivibacter subsaxonicus]
MTFPGASRARRLLLTAVLATGAWLGAGSPAAHAADDEVVVFAAASLTDVLQAIARRGGFEKVKFSFASSSTLARQIEQGAPAQLFISADEPWMDAVQKAGLVQAGSRRDWVTNRLAVVRPGAQEPGTPPETAEAVQVLLRSVLKQPEARIATGDPAHVPVGRYAQAALTGLGLWDAVAPRLARADNVRNALALVERGEAPLGIVYRTDALASPKVQVAALFPAASHAPIRYPLALLKGATPEAQRFAAYLFGPEAQALLREAGFGVAP